MRPRYSPKTNLNLAYDHANPYDGGGKLSLTNNGDQDIAITKFSFTSNCKIDSKPWGSLCPWDSDFSSVENPDGTKTYTVTFKTAFTVNAKGGADLSYGFQNTIGILPLGMPPKNVLAEINAKNETIPLVGSCQGTQCNDPLPGKNNFVYFTDWSRYARKYTANDLPIKITNGILYAFIGFNDKGEISLLDPNSDCKEIPTISMHHQRFPYLKNFLSFGGWTLSGPFSALASNPSARATFAKNAVAAMKQTGFSGIDIDWEYPQASDATNFAALLSDIRAELDKQAVVDGSKYYLSIAAPAGIDKIKAIANGDPSAWPKIFKTVDYVNPMTYDFHGAFDAIADNQSPWQTDPRDPFYKDETSRQYAIKNAVEAYLNLGCPPQKVNLGIPLYGRSMLVDTLGSTNGLWQKIVGTPNGEYDDTGVFDYKCIVDRDCNGLGQLPLDTRLIPASQNSYANTTMAPWGVSPSMKQVVSYVDVPTTEFLVRNAQRASLGGTFFWDASGDSRNQSNSLVLTSYKMLSNSAFKPTNPSSTTAHAMPKSMPSSTSPNHNPKVSAASRLEVPYFFNLQRMFHNFASHWSQSPQKTAGSQQNSSPVVPASSDQAFTVVTNTAELPCHYGNGQTNIVSSETNGAPANALIPKCKLPAAATPEDGESVASSKTNSFGTTLALESGKKSFILSFFSTAVYEYLKERGYSSWKSNIAYYAVYGATAFFLNFNLPVSLLIAGANKILAPVFGKQTAQIITTCISLLSVTNSLKELVEIIGGAILGGTTGQQAGKFVGQSLAHKVNNFFSEPKVLAVDNQSTLTIETLNC